MDARLSEIVPPVGMTCLSVIGVAKFTGPLECWIRSSSNSLARASFGHLPPLSTMVEQYEATSIRGRLIKELYNTPLRTFSLLSGSVDKVSSELPARALSLE